MDWDESVFALSLRDDILNNQQVTINEDDKQNIDKAIQTIKKCCEVDCPTKLLQGVKQNQQSLEKIAAYSGECEGLTSFTELAKPFLQSIGYSAVPV